MKPSNASPQSDPTISALLKSLRQQYKLALSVPFDAKSTPRRSQGWLTDYAVIDLTVALTAKKLEIPAALFQDALDIFRRAEKLLQRSRTFFCFRIVPHLKHQPWSILLLLTNRNLRGSHSSLQTTANDILPLLARPSDLRTMYSHTRHVLCTYSLRDQWLYAFPSEVGITFSDYYQDCDEVEQSLLSDKIGNDIKCMSGVFLGNVQYWLKRDREAIPHWRLAADTGQPEALMCIAGSHARLGNMQQAFQFAKKALRNGISRKMLNDPEFAKFRRHPLFARLKTIQKSKPRPPAFPLSPKWTIPKNLPDLVRENDGAWEDERWAPVLLTVMSGTATRGREISLSWQLEFDPYVRPFKAAGRQIKARGVEPDGYAWTNLIEREFNQRHPDLAGEFESDPELSTCVVSVQSEPACQKLLELVWLLAHPGR